MWDKAKARGSSVTATATRRAAVTTRLPRVGSPVRSRAAPAAVTHLLPLRPGSHTEPGAAGTAGAAGRPVHGGAAEQPPRAGPGPRGQPPCRAALTFHAFPERVLNVLQPRHDLPVDLRRRARAADASRDAARPPRSTCSAPPARRLSRLSSYPKGDFYPVFHALLQHKRLLLVALQITCKQARGLLRVPSYHAPG